MNDGGQVVGSLGATHESIADVAWLVEQGAKVRGELLTPRKVKRDSIATAFHATLVQKLLTISIELLRSWEAEGSRRWKDIDENSSNGVSNAEV